MSQIDPQRPPEQRPAKEPPDKTHLSNVARLPCMVCGRGPTVAHHLLRVPGGRRGTGKRNHDKWAVPLCQTHHRGLHEHGGEVKWFRGHGIEYQVSFAEELWRRRESFGEMLMETRRWRMPL